MAFVPVNNVACFAIRYTWQNAPATNTLYWYCDDDWNPTKLQQGCFDLATWWATSIAPLVTNTCQIREIYAYDLTTATSSSYTYVPVTAIDGERSSPSMPNNVTTAISLRTAKRGRAYRGRNYIVGLCEDQVVGNFVVESTTAGYLEAYDELLSTVMTVDNTIWCVPHRYVGKTPLVGGTWEAIIAATFVDSRIDTQKRRLPD